MENAGGTIVSPPEIFRKGYYGFLFADPDGHRFNVFQIRAYIAKIASVIGKVAGDADQHLCCIFKVDYYMILNNTAALKELLLRQTLLPAMQAGVADATTIGAFPFTQSMLMDWQRLLMQLNSRNDKTMVVQLALKKTTMVLEYSSGEKMLLIYVSSPKQKLLFFTPEQVDQIFGSVDITDFIPIQSLLQAVIQRGNMQ